MSGTDATQDDATTDETPWSDPAGAADGTPLDQGSIDQLIGETQVAAAAEVERRGLELLVGSTLVGYGRLPMLDIVVDRFARLLTTSMRKFTSDNCDVTVNRTRTTRVGDFLNRVTSPALIAVIHADPWDGYMLAALDSALIGSVVDVLLGGRRNQSQPIEGRPYTPIERALAERLVADVLIGDLKRAFDTVCPVEFVAERFETTPVYAAVTELSAAAVQFRADIVMDGGRGGSVDFMLPYSVIEPVRDILAQEYMGKKQGSDPLWASHLRGEVPLATVRLEAVLEKRVATVFEVARWQPGSVLVLDRRADDLVEMFCENMLVALARMGEQDGRIALQVEHRTAAESPPPVEAALAVAAALSH